MNRLKQENSNLEAGRNLVRHFLTVVTVFSIAVALWACSIKLVAGIGAFCTFIGMLLPAWQLTSNGNVHAGAWRELDRGAKVNLLFAFVGVLLTAVGYGIGLKTMF